MIGVVGALGCQSSRRTRDFDIIQLLIIPLAAEPGKVEVGGV